MLQPARRKYRKEQKGRNKGRGDRRRQGELWRIRPQGDRPGPPYRTADRGRAARDDASHQARRPDLDPHLPGQAGVAEARGSAHGQRQGQPRVLRLRESSRARCSTRWTASTRRWRAKRFALGAAKLPIRTTVRASPARLTGDRSHEDHGTQEGSAREVARGSEDRSCTPLLKEQFGLRMQKATQQLTNSAKLVRVRRDIARVRTLLNQKAGQA